MREREFNTLKSNKNNKKNSQRVHFYCIKNNNENSPTGTNKGRGEGGSLLKIPLLNVGTRKGKRETPKPFSSTCKANRTRCSASCFFTFPILLLRSLFILFHCFCSLLSYLTENKRDFKGYDRFRNGIQTRVFISEVSR